MSALTNGWPIGSGPYQNIIQDSALAAGVPPLILAWLLWKESRYSAAIIDGTRRSAVGAMGIAQFMPATAAQELGSTAAALDPAQAIPGAARYLAKLYRGTGSWTGALAAYNWGIGNVQRKGIDSAPAETVDYYTTILRKAGDLRMSSNNNDALLAVLLLGAAYMYTRRTAMVQPVVGRPQNNNLSSLPGNIGTGVGQALGGALGNLIGSWFKSGSTAAPTGSGANGGPYVSDIESGSSSDWSLPIGGDNSTDGDWWDVIA